MREIQTLYEIGVVCLVALLGGLVAIRLRLPVIVGYLAAGIMVGPHTPGLRVDQATVRTIAEWGVVFLMFALGVEFSFRSLMDVRKVGIVGGLIQIVLSILLGFGLGRLLGMPVMDSVFLGGIIAMSSTMIVMRHLDARGEADSYHGKVMLSILITQDLAVVVMVAAIPVLAAAPPGGLLGIGLNVLKAALYLAAAVFLAVRVVPLVFRAVAATKSRELFVLLVIGMSFAAAVGTQALGFSLALGAFVAGLIVSESEYSHQILAEVKPFRDVFAAVFFVSIGMLVDPRFLLVEYWRVAIVAVSVIIGKFLIVLLACRGLGVQGRAAIAAALGLAQIGEFSFVLVGIGVSRGVASESLYALTLATALVTMFLSPFVTAAGPWIYALATRSPLASRLLNVGQPEAPPVARPSDHVILCGYGRVGSRIGAAMARLDQPFAVIDYDQNVIRSLRDEGRTAIYGDASNTAILDLAGAQTASAAAVTLPDVTAAGIAVSHLRQKNSSLLIVARAHNEAGVRRLRDAGGDLIVWPEAEAGLEMIRRIASGLGLNVDSIEDLVRSVREDQE